MATWNINGLAPNKEELLMLISIHKLDVVLITEAHCTERSDIQINGYCTYITSHPDGTGHAGTAVIVRKSINHHLLPEYKTCHIQATTIAIRDDSGYLNASAVYCPPKHKISEVMFSQFFDTLGPRFIAGGDWNSKHTHWGSRLTNTRGRQLKTSIDRHNLNTISTPEPTSWPTDANKIPDVIDFFVVKGLSTKYFKPESCLDGSSDHSPVLLTFSNRVIEFEKRDSLYNHRTDWNSFREYIDEHISLNIRLKSAEDIDSAVMQITTLIQEACWKSTPAISHSECTNNYPLEIRAQIMEKRRLRRVWQLSRHPSDKTKLNKAILELKESLKIADENTLQTKLMTLSATRSTDYSLWKFTKNYNRPQEIKPPIRDRENKWARTNQEKADLFAVHLAEVFTPNAATDEESETMVRSILDQDLQLELPPKPVTPQEVRRTIRCLDAKKAPGFDLITKEILIELPRKALVFLTVLYNAMLRVQYFPSLWKVSQIIMVHKHGKPTNEKTSYRPISLLAVLSKVFEKLLLTRIEPILKERKIIPDHQFGFRRRHGTIEQAHRVYDRIRKALEQKQYCSSAFLDVQQAFDKVWHDGLLCKIKLSLPHNYFLILKSYLSDRLFQVREGGASSKFYDILAGVPQGSVLGPVLYTLYTADLPNTPGVTTATFADDTAALACNQDPIAASNTLQTGLDAVHKWMKKWRILASATKSVHVTFTLKNGDCPPVTLGDKHLPHANCVKYLGIHFDRRLTWKNHIQAKKAELAFKYKTLYWMLGRNSRLSLDNKLLIYSMVLKPVWMYGIQLWGSASDSHVNTMQRQQNKIIRSIANVPWFVTNNEIHENLKVKTVKEEIRNSAKAYKARLTSHPNELARQLTLCDYVKRLKRHHIQDLENRN